MSEDFETYLKRIKFEKYLKNLKKKIGDKTVIIYGTGSFFQYILKKYDLSSFNIIGISDMKYSIEQEGQKDLGYKIIHKENMRNYNSAYVLIATQRYLEILEDFSINLFGGTKTKVYPLARIPLFEMIKEIWER